jgi:hypothetical protein
MVVLISEILNPAFCDINIFVYDSMLALFSSSSFLSSIWIRH